MRASGQNLDIRRVTADTPAFRDLLHAALAVEPPCEPLEVHPAVESFLKGARNRQGDSGLVFGAYRHGRLEGACAALESPGASAIVYSAATRPGKLGQEAGAAALRTLIEEARARGIALLEALIGPEDLAARERLERAGFQFLTRLIYLRRRCNTPQAFPVTGPQLRWITYSDDTHQSFLKAIDLSYRGSRDCPELSGIRPTDAVLAGHRAVGEFDPSLWFVGLWKGRPVTVILLNKLPRDAILEVVYMGVSWDFRGRGLAHNLLLKAVETCRARSCSALVLAVDERNMPARRVYDRWGFVETGVRAAWIASPLATRG